MKRTLITLGTAALTLANLTAPASAADLMTLRLSAEKTAFTTEEISSGDRVVHGGLYIDNYTGIAKLRLILRNDLPVTIENGGFTMDPNGALDSDGNPRHGFFESHSTAMYTPESLIDDDKNIALWLGPEKIENGKGTSNANGVVRNPDCSFLSFDYRIPKDTPVGDYSCYISEKVIKSVSEIDGTVTVIPDLQVSDEKHPLTLGKDFDIKPVRFSVYMRGDVNCDGEISSEDAQIALLYYVRQELTHKTVTDADMEEIAHTKHAQAARYAADASADGKPDASDAQGILQYYVRRLAGKDADWNQIF